jgi:hypothetical protein
MKIRRLAIAPVMAMVGTGFAIADSSDAHCSEASCHPCGSTGDSMCSINCWWWLAE